MKQSAVEWFNNKIIEIDVEFETNLISKKTYLIKRKKIFNKAQALQKQQQLKEYWRGWKDYGASL
jgi:hypothetical protein